jgi:Uma2 family endonuclease
MSAEPIDFGTAPTVPAQEGWTVADVDALPDRDGVRYELVDGVPHVMTPPRIEHQNALLELHLALRVTAPPGLRVVQGRSPAGRGSAADAGSRRDPYCGPDVVQHSCG